MANDRTDEAAHRADGGPPGRVRSVIMGRPSFTAICTKTRIARSAPKSRRAERRAMAVVKGFEPLEGLHPHTLSRRAP